MTTKRAQAEAAGPYRYLDHLSHRLDPQHRMHFFLDGSHQATFKVRSVQHKEHALSVRYGAAIDGQRVATADAGVHAAGLRGPGVAQLRRDFARAAVRPRARGRDRGILLWMPLRPGTILGDQMIHFGDKVD